LNGWERLADLLFERVTQFADSGALAHLRDHLPGAGESAGVRGVALA
jgi:hypothetical protein